MLKLQFGSVLYERKTKDFIHILDSTASIDLLLKKI